MKVFSISFVVLAAAFLMACRSEDGSHTQMSAEALQNKIKGAWAGQVIGCTYGGPTEFRYQKRIIPDSVVLHWSDTMMLHWMTHIPGLYDDVYMDLTFVEVMEKEGIDAPAGAHAMAYANAGYPLWHANQQGRYNVLNGMMPPQSGHWMNNPHADDIDFQIEADFAGIMNPGMPNSAAMICDRIGHIMNSGDGYYGGLYVAGMYSFAFVTDDIKEVVTRPLQLIPAESKYRQCMEDVIAGFEEHPDDWKATWRRIEDRWGEDIGCPDGVGQDFNIDATINSAYVLLGLLYGQGDFGKTMDIATRAGQDSDCNPATAAGILGTVLGYDRIPEQWARGLALVEDIDFQYTTMSLNKVYDISLRQALEMIRRNGGEVRDDLVRIRLEEPVPVALEQNFPGYYVNENRPIQTTLDLKRDRVFKAEFEGVGVVLRGGIRIPESGQDTAEEVDLSGQFVEAEVWLDGASVGTVRWPLDWRGRAQELFFRYELPEGRHELELRVAEPDLELRMEVWNMIVYGREVR